MPYLKRKTPKLVGIFLAGAVVAWVIQWVVVSYGPVPHTTSARLFYEDFRVYVRISRDKSVSQRQMSRSLRPLQPYLLGYANGLQSYLTVIGAGANKSSLNALMQDVINIPMNQVGSPRFERHLTQALSILQPLGQSHPTRQQLDHALAVLNTELLSTHW